MASSAATCPGSMAERRSANWRPKASPNTMGGYAPLACGLPPQRTAGIHHFGFCANYRLMKGPRSPEEPDYG